MTNWDTLIGKDQPKNTVLNNLLSVPLRDKKETAPRFPIIEKNVIQQADLLMMPTDKDYKYILTVVDVGSRKCDGVPLKNKESETVKNAFETIYNEHKILELPYRLEVDDGSEFKGETLKYFNRHRVWVRVAKPGRHRQQGLVERYNQLIAKYLFKRMTAQELLTAEESKEWVDDLPSLIEYINKRAEKRIAKIKKKRGNAVVPDPVIQTENEELLAIGTQVRVQLDYPINPVTGAKLHGKFRSTDIRWHPEKREIKQVVIKPDSPVLYLLNNTKHKDHPFEPIGYARNQLLPVKENETHYDGKEVIKGTHDTYIIDKLLSRKRMRGLIFYKVKWEGFDDPADQTWEPRAQLIKDVPQLVEAYEKAHKRKR